MDINIVSVNGKMRKRFICLAGVCVFEASTCVFWACLFASTVANLLAGFERVRRLFFHVVPRAVAVHVGVRTR